MSGDWLAFVLIDWTANLVSDVSALVDIGCRTFLHRDTIIDSLTRLSLLVGTNFPDNWLTDFLLVFPTFRLEFVAILRLLLTVLDF